jgi:hypothetical protein
MPATYEPIATTTLGSANATITFSSITSAYTDLRLILVGSVTSGTIIPKMTFNGVTTSTYSFTNLSGNGSSASSGSLTSQTGLDLGYQTGFSSGTISTIAIDIFSYAGSTNKTCLIATSMDKNGSGAVERFVGLSRNTAAISSITLTSPAGTFATGTTATLYGILKA